MDVSEVLEIIGVVAFSMVGVFVGIEYELDVFGIFVVSLCSALGGGIIRDLVLGVTPPVSFVRPVYTLTVLITVVVSLILFKIVDKKLSRKSVKRLPRKVRTRSANCCRGPIWFLLRRVWAAVRVPAVRLSLLR